jgi:N-acetylgalactosamine kinase
MNYFVQLEESKSEMAALCATSEQYIGTIGGGMDQAIAFLATKGSTRLNK